MVRLRNASTRSGAGPILGTLGALGLTIAFVALRRSKPAKATRTVTSGTLAITWRPDRRGRAMHTEEALSALFESLYNSFAKTAASSRGSWPSSGTPRGRQTTGWSCDRECPSCGGWRRARRSVAVPDARGARHRRAGQAMPVASRTGACRAPTPARSSELCGTGSGCGPSVGDHRAASPITDTAYVRRLTSRLIGENRGAIRTTF